MRNQELAELIGDASRQALRAIVQLCLNEQVDALLLSGDLYDGEQTSMKTARFLADQIDLLHAAGVQVFMIRGNHDAMSQITKELTFPGSVTLFTGRGKAVMVKQDPGCLPIVIHGISFADRHAPDSLLSKYLPPTEGAVNIGLLHTSLGGAAGHSPYAPCSAADLQGMGYRYWALGHIHGRSEATTGATTIVMPGIPQGRDVNEAGEKSVSLVLVADDGTIIVEQRRTSIAQFERVAVDLSDVEDWSEVARRIADTLGPARDAVRSDHLVARLHLKGATPMAWQLRRDPGRLLTEAERLAGGLHQTSIDTVNLECFPLPMARPTTGATPLVELRALMDAAWNDGAFRSEMTDMLTDMRAFLKEPSILRGDTEQDEADLLAQAARNGIDDVFARLAGSN